ncbi:UDP-N-acetylmuramoyl-L-alanyl-D-glutamate--2,6-diaminopimelate ligase [Viridibacillus arvi]|uniref:UDP-N-acetylmuramoyl-L-alanyl-D-glutamate--2, 6-diaminopimelate ligase n=1 Tax=Viridibacillus arvi TaxID=263475 RepID=UPI0036E7DC41
MKLNILLEHVDKAVNSQLLDIDVDIEGIATNSSLVRPNDIFVAIPGFRVDGHQFIDAAIQAGASVVVGEKDLKDLIVPYVRVSNSRLALAQMACQFYGNPSRNKIVIGITGTNGKTTTTYMLKYILENCGRSCSLFGTVQNVVNGKPLPSVNTTPDALELQKQIAMSEDEFIIMEVSSHGLSQYRVEGVEFDYCLFTNLDKEHLDYHKDMEAYFSVKASLFDQLKPNGLAIINQMDNWGKKLADLLTSKGYQVFLVGDQSYHDLQIIHLQSGISTVSFKGNQSVELSLNILGKHNILNASMAFLTALLIGIPQQKVVYALEKFPGVPGRFEMLQHPNGAMVVIDYAHTADAFYQCLQTAREEGANRVFHVFGFRGDRDKEKRRDMVSVSKEISDVHILTLDDLNDVPYEEMEQALYALKDGGYVISDRTIAIKEVLEHAHKGDWVCITGKGAEDYQQKFRLPTASDKETVEFLFQQIDQETNGGFEPLH